MDGWINANCFVAHHRTLCEYSYFKGKYDVICIKINQYNSFKIEVDLKYKQSSFSFTPLRPGASSVQKRTGQWTTCITVKTLTVHKFSIKLLNYYFKPLQFYKILLL